MKKKRISYLFLLTALFLTSTMPPLHAGVIEPSFFEKTWQKIWGDTYLVGPEQKKKIKRRRTAIVVALTAGAATLAGLGTYGLIKALTGLSSFLWPRKINCGIQACELVANCEQPPSAWQGCNECGIFALANAAAVQANLDANSEATDRIVEQGSANANTLRAIADTIRDDQQLPANRGITPFPPEGYMLEQSHLMQLNAHDQNNNQLPVTFIGRLDEAYRPSPRGTLQIVGTDGNLGNNGTVGALQTLVQGARNPVHFLLNPGGNHWVPFSLAHNPDNPLQPRQILLDSSNGPFCSSSETQAQIDFVNGLVQQAVTNVQAQQNAAANQVANANA